MDNIEEVKKILDEIVSIVGTDIMHFHHFGKGLEGTKTTSEYAQQICRLFELKEGQIKGFKIIGSKKRPDMSLPEESHEPKPERATAKAIRAKKYKPDENRLLTYQELLDLFPKGETIIESACDRITKAQDAKTASTKDAELRRAMETISTCHEGELAQKDAKCQQRVENILREIEVVIRQAQTSWSKAQFGAVLLNRLRTLRKE